MTRMCRHCRRAIFRTMDGNWYHVRNSSAKCRPGEGPGPVAEPAARDDV